MTINRYTDGDLVARELAAGRHRELVGGHWEELGRLQLDFLVERGLRPEHRLLDVGCGCLRAGLQFAGYLDPGNYYGLDLSQDLLDWGRRELEGAGLGHRVPAGNLVRADRFDVSAFGETTMDWAIAQSVFTHLPWNEMRLCLARLAAVMAPGSCFFASYFERSAASPGTLAIEQSPGIVTYPDADPYHYSLTDLAHACHRLPWTLQPIGEWGHPRHQRIVAFRREPDRLPPVAGARAEGDSRDLDADQAASLAPGDNHYRAFVGPPDRFDFMSATQFSLLFALGLREHHRLLDFGCGSLRAGRLLIPYLRKSRYCGIDPNVWLIDEALRRELGYDIVAVKAPRFAHHDDFDCTVFGETFDFILAQSVITHCGRDLAARALHSFADVLAPSGLVLFTFVEGAGGDHVAGWRYPECVSHGAGEIAELLAQAGLVGRILPWYHPAAVWCAAARSDDALPARGDLRHLRGVVLRDGQFRDSGERKAS